MDKKVIILHDTFLYKWGGERLILMMGKALGADLASGFFSLGSFDLRKEWFTGKIIPVSSEVFRKGFRHIKLKYHFYTRTKFLSEYDTVIFSGDCLSAVRNVGKNTKTIYYCHTPPRYLYDLFDHYLAKVPYLLRPIFYVFCYIFRLLYQRDISKVDEIITNSKNTQKRILKFLGRDSLVLYPPVDLDRFRFESQGDYYLSFARLADAKRVDRVVKAFTQMPDKKLIVVYGKNDPQKEAIFSIAEGSNNIRFITLENNDDLYGLIWNCIATLYVPVDEDFGMSPVESMAAGKPVIWVNEGWLKESIIDGKTGILIDPSCQVEDIISSVQDLDAKKSLSMRKDCEERAQDFSLESFAEKLKSYV